MTSRGGMPFGSWLVLKVRQRLIGHFRLTRIRWAERLRLAPPSDLDIRILPWSDAAAVPGNAAQLGWASPAGADAMGRALAKPVIEHRFRLLSHAAYDITIADAARHAVIAALARSLPKDAVASYRPIDWHRDTRIGYRWAPDNFYLDVPVAPASGADIKFPRELSRFQHIGALARGDLEAGGTEFLLQLLDWIVANPVRYGVNWACTMDVALRAVNWIWGLRLFEPVVARYPDIQRIVANSLRDHGRHIADNLEYYADCTSNHYLANIAGLIYIGAACPPIPEADAWLAFALQELVSEMERQVYPDGADYEASSHYHRLVADMFVSCAALAERIPPARRTRLARVPRNAWRHRPPRRPLADLGIELAGEGQLLPAAFYARLARMAEYTAALTKPNGLVPQIGDNDSARVHFLLPTADDDFRDHAHLAATVGELLDRPDLIRLGARAAAEGELVAGDLRGRVVPPPARDIEKPLVLFPDAGVAVGRAGSAWLAVTCGPNGQGGRGGHGHNDKNGFELNVAGRDFIVDGGCPVYTAAPETRNRYRSTATHSTIVVDGLEQDRWTEGMAGLFRLPERSSPRLEARPDGSIVGRHSGYGAVHERRFELTPASLVIEDRLDDPRPRTINFNLDPAVVVEGLDSRDDRVSGRLVHRDGAAIELSIIGATDPRVDAGAFGVGYGQPVDNLRLSVRMTAVSATTELRWAS